MFVLTQPSLGYSACYGTLCLVFYFMYDYIFAYKHNMHVYALFMQDCKVQEHEEDHLVASQHSESLLALLCTSTGRRWDIEG